MLFDNVVIAGPGLIGGSLGMAIRSRKLARSVIGAGHRAESLSKAVAMGAVDGITLNLEGAVAEADLVVLATGVAMIPRQAAAVLPKMKKGAILTDVGSVKGAICDAVKESFRNSSISGVRFVGGHPLAGSERRGIAFARADLFDGALCVLTALKETDADGSACSAVRELWKAVGCKVSELSPEKHDALLAQASHLPHAIAACLINSIAGEALEMTAQGFLDTTRIASGDPALWTEIFLANRQSVISAVKSFGAELTQFAQLLEKSDSSAIQAWLHKAKNNRDIRLRGDSDK